MAGYGPPGAPPPGQSPWGTNPRPARGLPLAIIGGVIAALVLLGVAAFFLFRPVAVVTQPTVSPSPVVVPSTSAPVVTPTLPSPSQTVSPTPTASPSVPRPGQCGRQLSGRQCSLAKAVGTRFVVVETCVPNQKFAQNDAIACNATLASRIKGAPTVYLFRDASRKELDTDIDQFFTSAGVKPGTNWLRPPAKTIWFYRSDPKKTIGTLASANVKSKGEARLAWTYNKELIYAQVTSVGGDAKNLIDWWSR